MDEKAQMVSAVSSAFDAIGFSFRGLEAEYRWRFPRSLPKPLRSYFQRYQVGDQANLYRKTIALRDALRDFWKESRGDEARDAAGGGRDDPRTEIAKWFVKQWGGIGSVDDDRIRRYVAMHDEILKRQCEDRVSTWSKVLALRDPDRFAIYDSRVAMALNASQIVCSGDGTGIRFPAMEVGRGESLRRYRRQIEAITAGWPCPDRHFYLLYLDVLRSIAHSYGVRMVDVEMALFSMAERIAAHAVGE